MIAKFLTELKIKSDDYGNLYAQTPDGTFYELIADLINDPFIGKIKLGKEVEPEARGDEA